MRYGKQTVDLSVPITQRTLNRARDGDMWGLRKQQRSNNARAGNGRIGGPNMILLETLLLLNVILQILDVHFFKLTMLNVPNGFITKCFCFRNWFFKNLMVQIWMLQKS